MREGRREQERKAEWFSLSPVLSSFVVLGSDVLMCPSKLMNDNSFYVICINTISSINC